MTAMCRRSPRALVVLLATAAFLASTIVGPASTPASADTGEITTFTYPAETVTNPSGITAGPDGNLWVTLGAGFGGCCEAIGRLTPDGVVTRFSDPDGYWGGLGTIAVGPDANLWFTYDGNPAIGRVTTAGTITEFTGLPGSGLGIASGADGNLWFTVNGDDRIGRITTAGSITYYDDPAGHIDYPKHIVTGGDGNVWFTSVRNNRIGRITPAGEITTFADPAGQISALSGITAGPDGNVWFTSAGNSRIGRITPAGEITTFTDPAGNVQYPAGITAGPDGNVWFTSGASVGRVGRITPAGEITTFSDLGGNVQWPANIAAGPDGMLWFTGYVNFNHRIWRVDPGAGLTVTKRADQARVLTGEAVDYHLTVENVGDVPLTGVDVTDPAAPDCEQPVPDLAVGAQHTIDCSYTTTAEDAGTYANTASVDSDQTNPVVSNRVEVGVGAPAPALSVTKSADQRTVLTGEPIDYHLAVSNAGNVPLTGVAVTDPAATDCEQPVPDLAVGAQHTIDCSYTTTAEDAGTYANTASVDSDQTDPVASNRVDVTVAAPTPALTVSKSADQTGVVTGEAIDYHLVITNAGNVPLTGITVSDPAAPDCEQPVPDLAVGAHHTVDCSYLTTVDDAGTYANTATVDSEQTNPAESNRVDVTVAFRHQPDLRVKRAGGVFVGDDTHNADAVGQTVQVGRNRGGRAVFYLRVENDGDGPDRFHLHRLGSDAGLRVRYFRGRTTTDVTRAINHGTFTTATLDPGAAVTIRVEVTVTNTARRNQDHDVVLQAESAATASRLDTVKATVFVH